MTVAGFTVKWGAGRCDVFVTGKGCGSEILRAGGVVGNLVARFTVLLAHNGERGREALRMLIS